MGSNLLRIFLSILIYNPATLKPIEGSSEMPQKQRDTTRIATTFGWTGSTDPTDVPYQGDEA